MAIWNPWHGCHKLSPGCMHCYVYRRDAEFGKDSTVVEKTASFSLPVRRARGGGYKLQPEAEPVFACMTSDFFVEDADLWRPEAWAMMRERADLRFVIITKRIHRFSVGLPADWGAGYPNVAIMCTCENQQMADYRLPIFLSLPIQSRSIIHEPMLERIDISPYLRAHPGAVSQVICGGESGPDARPCDYAWVLDTRRQCMEHGVSFHFKQTGAAFVRDGRLYRVPRAAQMSQARRAGIDFAP